MACRTREGVLSTDSHTRTGRTEQLAAAERREAACVDVDWVRRRISSRLSGSAQGWIHTCRQFERRDTCCRVPVSLSWRFAQFLHCGCRYLPDAVSCKMHSTRGRTTDRHAARARTRPCRRVSQRCIALTRLHTAGVIQRKPCMSNNRGSLNRRGRPETCLRAKTSFVPCDSLHCHRYRSERAVKESVVPTAQSSPR